MPELQPIVAVIAAPRVAVFQGLTRFEGPSALWPGESPPELLAKRGSTVDIRVRRRVAGRLVTLTHRLTITPPSRIDSIVLTGPIPELRETIELGAVGRGRTRIEYRCELSLGPGLRARLLERAVGRRRHERERRRTVDRWRSILEAAARASGTSD